MKKENAQELYEELKDKSLSAGSWSVHLSEPVQEGRRVRYGVVLTHDASSSGHVPMIPFEVSEFLHNRGFSSGDVTKRLIDPNEDSVDDSLWRPQNRQFSSDPYYATLIDDGAYNELPRTAEEERRRRLSSKISSAIGTPGNTRVADALAAEFETVGEVLAASEDELRAVTGIGEKTARAILERRSPALQRRLEEFDGDVLVVTKNDSGTFEPLYVPDSKETINRELLDGL